MYLAVTRVSTSKITSPYSDWSVNTECEGTSNPFGLPLNTISNLESTSRFLNLSLRSVTNPISNFVFCFKKSCTNCIAKGVQWRRADGGVDPTTCTNKTVNFCISLLWLPEHVQPMIRFHFQNSRQEPNLYPITPPVTGLGVTYSFSVIILTKQLIQKRGRNLRAEDFDPTTLATKLLCPETGEVERSLIGVASSLFSFTIQTQTWVK
jgi:hypothetical protein